MLISFSGTLTLAFNVMRNIFLRKKVFSHHAPFLTYVFFYSRFAVFSNFWTPRLPDGVLSNCPCLSVGPCVRWSVRPSVFKYLRDRSFFSIIFGPHVYPMGSMVITLVR